MEKIQVVICTGTACHLFGNSELYDSDSWLPKEMSEYVEVTASRCLECCKDRNFGNAPFVMINQQIIAQASAKVIIEKIEEIKRNDSNGN